LLKLVGIEPRFTNKSKRMVMGNLYFNEGCFCVVEEVVPMLEHSLAY
jgi:hypothetical protein